MATTTQNPTGLRKLAQGLHRRRVLREAKQAASQVANEQALAYALQEERVVRMTTAMSPAEARRCHRIAQMHILRELGGGER